MPAQSLVLNQTRRVRLFVARFSPIVATLLAIACSSRERATPHVITLAEQDSINRTLPGYVIDSILPVEEQLRRFRLAVGGEATTELNNASPSRDALVGRFMKAINTADSNDLRAMVVNAREFADLVYPESPSVRPPYRQDPALVWQTIQNPSTSGFRRLLRRVPGSRIALIDYRCDPQPTTQGNNRLWTGCMLNIADATGATSRHRLFGSIIERDQRFKIVSYRNEF